jgi:hypothetical protein
MQPQVSNGHCASDSLSQDIDRQQAVSPYNGILEDHLAVTDGTQTWEPDVLEADQRNRTGTRPGYRTARPSTSCSQKRANERPRARPQTLAASPVSCSDSCCYLDVRVAQGAVGMAGATLARVHI